MPLDSDGPSPINICLGSNLANLIAFEPMSVNLHDCSAAESRSLERSSGSSSVFKDLFFWEPTGLEFLPEPEGLEDPDLVGGEVFEEAGVGGLLLAGFLWAFSGNCQQFSLECPVRPQWMHLRVHLNLVWSPLQIGQPLCSALSALEGFPVLLITLDSISLEYVTKRSMSFCSTFVPLADFVLRISTALFLISLFSSDSIHLSRNKCNIKASGDKLGRSATLEASRSLLISILAFSPLEDWIFMRVILRRWRG